jgi:hypothetical protein
VAEVLQERGFTVRVEAPGASGCVVDVLAKKVHVAIAFEVETGPNAIWGKARLILESGVNRVLFVALNARVADTIRHELAARGAPPEAVDVTTVERLLQA